MNEQLLYDQLWEIVKKVATVDSTHYNDNDGNQYCPFCAGMQPNVYGDVPHEPECIIVKAQVMVQKLKE